MGDGLLAGGVDFHAPAGFVRMAAERGIDGAAVLRWAAACDGPIGFAGAAGGEFGLGGDERGFAQGDQQATGCVCVQAVGEPGAVLAA